MSYPLRVTPHPKPKARRDWEPIIVLLTLGSLVAASTYLWWLAGSAVWGWITS